MFEDTINRREALLGMATAAIGVVAAGAGYGGVAYADEAAAWDRETDVVVIGAGSAGDMAALECANAGGFDVLLLESLDFPISSSHLCAGQVVMCETEMAPGSREDLFADLVTAAQGDCQEGTIRSYVDIAPEVYKMLTGWGVHFYTTEQMAYMSQPWDHVAEGDMGMHVMTILEGVIAQNEHIELVTGNRARKLVVDQATGTVLGVEVETADGTVRYKANKGVIITSGDFTRNPELAKAYGRKGSEFIIPMTGVGLKGDGLLMGLAVGADVSYIGAGVSPSTLCGFENQKICMPFLTAPCILVGLDGKRFHKESDNYVLITQSAMDLPKSLFFQVYDAPMRKMLEEWQGTALYGLPDEPEIIGETLAELGAAIKAKYPEFDDAEFVAQVERYNGYVETGEDAEFGRTHLSGDAGDLAQIATGPFYAIASGVSTTHFNGGLKTDDAQRVMSAIEKSPIPHLYAAGSVTGGFHGFGYMSGSAFGHAIMHGVVAARTLVADMQ